MVRNYTCDNSYIFCRNSNSSMLIQIETTYHLHKIVFKTLRKIKAKPLKLILCFSSSKGIMPTLKNKMLKDS